MSYSSHWFQPEPEYSPLITHDTLYRSCGHILPDVTEENALGEPVTGKENTYYSTGHLHWCSDCLEQGKHLENKG